jgi:uncharacterized membrane protein
VAAASDSGAGAGRGPIAVRAAPPLWEVTLWPHRSLSPAGFRAVLGGAAAAFALPVVALAGTKAIWVMAPLAAFHVWLLGWFFRRSYRDAELTETVRLWPDLIAVERREPSGRVLSWAANPYWVRVALRPEGRVENYLTLSGGGREIELGAFLAPWERESLGRDLEAALARARAMPDAPADGAR